MHPARIYKSLLVVCHLYSLSHHEPRIPHRYLPISVARSHKTQVYMNLLSELSTLLPVPVSIRKSRIKFKRINHHRHSPPAYNSKKFVALVRQTENAVIENVNL